MPTTEMQQRAKVGSILAVCAILLLPGVARADNPIIVGIFKDILVGLAAEWLYDEITDDGKQSCKTTTICIEDDSAAETKIQITIRECTSINDNDTVISLPLDFPGLPLPGGYALAEEMLLSSSKLGTRVEYSSINYEADVLDPKFSGDVVFYSTRRTTQFRYSRDPMVTPGESEFAVPVTIEGLALSTQDIPGTDAVVRYELRVTAEELGTLFHSAVVLEQGELPVITGDILASEFTADFDSAILESYSEVVNFTVPAEVGSLNLEIEFFTEGRGAIPQVFTDGFESGDTSAWSSTVCRCC